MNTIYIGASNKKLGLHQFTIYKDRPVNLIEMLKAQYPAVECLFVSVDDFAEVEEDLHKPESLIYAASQKMKG